MKSLSAFVLSSSLLLALPAQAEDAIDDLSLSVESVEATESAQDPLQQTARPPLRRHRPGRLPGRPVPAPSPTQEACLRFRAVLNDAQKLELRAAHQALVTAQRTAQPALQQARREAHQALLAQNFSEAALTAKVNDLGAAETTVNQNRFTFAATVLHQVADNELQKRLALRCLRAAHGGPALR